MRRHRESVFGAWMRHVQNQARCPTVNKQNRCICNDPCPALPVANCTRETVTQHRSQQPGGWWKRGDRWATVFGGQKIIPKIRNCKSGCAYNGITDVLTNLLMKVQRDAVSENSGHNSRVSLTMVWTWNFPTLSANVTESAAWCEVTFP